MRSKLAMGGLILGTAWGAYRRLRSPVSLQGSYTNASTRVIIIGGGFGGLSVARGLARALQGPDDVGVALMDRMNCTMFWPMVPSVIPSNAEVRHVAHSLRCVLKPGFGTRDCLWRLKYPYDCLPAAWRRRREEVSRCREAAFRKAGRGI